MFIYLAAFAAISSLSWYISPYGRNSSACFAARTVVASAVIVATVFAAAATGRDRLADPG